MKHGPLPVKLIIGFIYPKEETYLKAKAILTKRLGPIDFESIQLKFNFTDYYYKEMGHVLYRRFIAFKKLKKPTSLVKIKRFCIKIEKRFSCDSKRVINIDPGYINEAKLILSTTKDYSHRIALSKDVYAEATLIFKKGSFCDLPYTYPDYRTNEYKKIFLAIRHIYSTQIHNGPKG